MYDEKPKNDFFVPLWLRPSSWVIGGIAVILLIVFAGANNSLVATEENMFTQEALYGGALDNVSQKIVGSYEYLQAFLEPQSEYLLALTQARAGFDNARDSGTPADQVFAAQLFNATADVVVSALAEDSPQFQGEQATMAAMNTLEEAVNEIVTKFDDWQETVRSYNTTRRSFPTNLIANVLGFESSYPYYEPRNTELDVRSLINRNND